MTQGLKGLRYYLSKSEFSVKKQLMMKNIGKHTVKKMRELRYEVIKNWDTSGVQIFLDKNLTWKSKPKRSLQAFM